MRLGIEMSKRDPGKALAEDLGSDLQEGHTEMLLD